MTQSNEPNDRRIVDLWSTVGNRQLRTINRRVNRLEDTQVTWGEFNVEFDRLYDEIDEVKIEMTQLKTEMNQRFDEPQY
ncbi:MAG: hypothetical protein HC778_03985 [Chamaesiphon sp. CSU_1_12]|nr:hypothetical protein [Chamaesiphon sp. CSU_1_12]